MKMCPCCKREYSDRAESCPACYVPLMPKQETRLCPDCHEEIPAYVERCFHCGGGLEYGAEEEDGQEASVEWREVLPAGDPQPEDPMPAPDPHRPVPRPAQVGMKKDAPGCVSIVFWAVVIIVVRLLLSD